MSSQRWRCCHVSLPVGERVHLMGVLNVTPDSFSDGGRFFDAGAAVKRALQMKEEGADIIDVGGESTRPGAAPVEPAEEMRRVLPVVEAIASDTTLPVSVDTMKADVAAAALQAGAIIVNDVSAMRADPAMARVVAESGAGVVLMHMLGEPRTMQKDPRYDDVVSEVNQTLLGWARGAEEAGIAREAIVLDPGIGFGKTVEHNLSLVRHVAVFADGGYPVLVGPSRKSFIGTVLGADVDQRLEGTAAVVTWLTANGANIIRVHDVRAMSDVIRMTAAITAAPAPSTDTSGDTRLER